MTGEIDYRTAAAGWQRMYDEVLADNGRFLGRIKTLENDLEHALVTVGAFRQAIEDIWSKSDGESEEDGFIVSYVIPCGPLHRAIGLTRGTDAGGTLLQRIRVLEDALRRLNARTREALASAPAWPDQAIPEKLLILCDEASDTLLERGDE